MVCWKMPNFFKWANTAPISQVSGGTGAVQKDPSSKAAGPLARRTYTEYVSTTRGRERRWRTLRLREGMLFQQPPKWNGYRRGEFFAVRYAGLW
jgi:hypothetical protein